MTGEHAIVVLMFGALVLFGWFILSMKYLGQKVTGWMLAVLLAASIGAMFYFGIDGWRHAPTAPQREWCRNITILFAVMLTLIGVLVGWTAWKIHKDRKEKA